MQVMVALPLVSFSSTSAPSALRRYESFDPSEPVCWLTLAADLRSEADRYTGGPRKARLDRAIECEHRASRRRAQLRQVIPVISVDEAKALYARVAAEVGL